MLLTSCVAITFGPSAPEASAKRPWPVTATCPTPARSAAYAAEVLALMNGHRAKAGLPPLVASTAVARVAHLYACEIAARGEISHTGSDGSTLTERLARGGISADFAAENTASGQKNPAELVAAWMASPGHRANILRPAARALGLGLADSARTYWVANFTS